MTSTGGVARLDGAAPRYLHHSEYRTWKNCRRRWYLTYYKRLGANPDEETVSGVRTIGTACHLALEGHYGHDLDADRVLVAYYEDLIRTHPLEARTLASDLSYARTMVSGYLSWVASTGVDADFETVATEADVSVPIDTGFDFIKVTLRGRLDQVVRRRDGTGTLLLRDFKTVGSLVKGPDLQRDEQLRFYALLQWLLTRQAEIPEPVDGALYTMLLRSKRTARATGPFYATVHVTYNDHDHESMLLRVIRVALETERARALLDSGADHRSVAYPNPGSECRYCPFAAVCTMADDGSRFDDALDDLYVSTDPMGHYGSDRIDLVKTLLGRD